MLPGVRFGYANANAPGTACVANAMMVFIGAIIQYSILNLSERT